MDATPERYGHLRAPWPPPPAPGSCTDLGSRFDVLTGCVSIFRRLRDFPSGRFRLAGPGRWYRPLTCLRRVRSATSSGMDATPALFRPTQSPLVASLLHQAPVSSTGLGSIFRSSRCFPSVALTSRLPVVDPGHSLASDSLRRVKPATSSGVDATPALFRPTQSPLAAVLLRQAPPSVVTARCRGDFRSVGLGETFRCFRGFPSRRFHLAVPNLDGGLHDTAFDRLAPVSSDRVLGMHATPLPPGGRVPPGRQPTCARFLLSSTRAIARPSLSPEPCRLASRRFSISVVRLSTSRFSGPRRPR